MYRHSSNPILTREDIPDVAPQLVDATSVFNPGAIKFGNQYLLMLRVQARSRETYLMMADSKDGIRFFVRPQIVEFNGLEQMTERIYHIYDARLSEIDGEYYVMFAMDMEGGCQLGVGKTKDFKSFDFLGIASNEDIRNGVLFPEKVKGKFLRMDRPNKSRHSSGPTSGSTIWLSESENMIDWKPVAPLIDGRFHYWDEFIGSGPPPVKTREGWLHVYHGVAGHFGSANIYQGGVLLLDLEDPSKVIGRCRHNILEPREIWEMAGQVPNVCFPSGWVVEDFDNEGFARANSEVKIYYGAADSVVGLYITSIDELLKAAKEDPIV